MGKLSFRGGSGMRILHPGMIGQGTTINSNPEQLRLNPPNLAQFNAPAADFLNNTTGGGKRRLRRRSKRYKIKSCKSKTLRKSNKYSKKRKSKKRRSRKR